MPRRTPTRRTPRRRAAPARPAATLTVRVTARHIRDGETCSYQGCPIARALSELPGVSWAGVVPRAADVAWGWQPRVIYALPKAATEFVVRFDTHKRVQPATFRLRRVSP